MMENQPPPSVRAQAEMTLREYLWVLSKNVRGSAVIVHDNVLYYYYYTSPECTNARVDTRRRLATGTIRRRRRSACNQLSRHPKPDRVSVLFRISSLVATG